MIIVKKPKIRFKGFTETWEQRKLNEICNYHSSSLTAKDSCTDGEYDLFDVNSLIGKTSSSCIDENYITIIKDGAGVGRTRLLPKNTMFLGTMGALTPKGIDLNFLFQIVSKAELGRFCTGSTIPHIYFRDYGENLFFVPSNREQKPIGDYFSKLDNLITLHQRKCENLKKLKKFMLQKLFPQNGENVPEIRFSNFTDTWEQRKLGDIVDRVTRKNTDLISNMPLTISAQYGLIDQSQFFDKRVASKDISGYYLINNGEFAYNKSTSVDAPWGAIKRLNRYENGVLSTLYIVFKIKNNNDVNSDFLVSYYDTNIWHKGISGIATEGARNHGLLNISPNDFFLTRLFIPRTINEQKQIGSLFSKLDHLITLHQSKCDKLKEVKKYMLQNMFI